MATFSKEILDYLLGIETFSGSLKQTVTYHDKGPARWDRYLTMVEGRKKAFQHRELTPPSSKKKKIIFCNAMINEKAISSEEIDLLSDVFRYFEVYLWPGKNKSLPKPESSFTEFLENMEYIPPATKQDALVELNKQTLDPNDYLIIDLEKYIELIQNAKNYLEFLKKNKDSPQSQYPFNFLEQNNTSPYLDLTRFNLDDEVLFKKLLLSVNPSSIKKITMQINNENDLDKILQHFDGLTELVINPVTDSSFQLLQNYLMQYPEKFQAIHIKLLNCAVKNGTEITLPVNIKAVSIFPFYENQCKVRFLPTSHDKDHRLETLNIVDQRGIKIADLTECTHLKSLVIENLDGQILFPKNKEKIESLTLKKVDLHNINLNDFTNLKSLTIIDCEFDQTLDLSKLKKLEQLNIKGLSDWHRKKQVIKLGDNPLKHLTLDTLQLDESSWPALSRVESLTLNSIAGSNFKKLNNFNQLKKLNISMSSDELILNLMTSHFPCLEEANVRYGPRMEYNFKDYAALKKISFSSTSSTTEVSALAFPPTLSSIEVASCDHRKINMSESIHLKHLSITFCRNTNWHEFNISSMKLLETLKLGHNNVTQTELPANIKDCQQLKYIEVQGAKIKSANELGNAQVIYLQNCNLPEVFDCNNMNVSELSFHGTETPVPLNIINGTNLEIVRFAHIKEPIKLQNCHKIKKLFLDHINETAFPQGEFADIDELVITSCKFKTLDLSGFTNLKKLTIIEEYYEDSLEKLILPKQLIDVELRLKKLEDFNFAEQHHLKQLVIHNKIKTIELPPHDGNLEVFKSEFQPHRVSPDDNPPHYNFSKYKKLREVELGSYSSVNLSDTENLTQLTLQSDAAKQINVSHCKKLQTFKLLAPPSITITGLQDCQALRKFALSANADYAKKLSMDLPKECDMDFKNYRGISNYYGMVSSSSEEFKSDDWHLHLQNASNPVSCFSYDDESYSIDSVTELRQTPYKAQGGMRLMLEAKDSISTVNHRLRIFNKISYDRAKSKFVFEQKPSNLVTINDTIAKLKQEDLDAAQMRVYKNENLVAGYLEGKFVPGTLYPLPTDQSMLYDPKKTNFKLFCSSPEDITFLWDKELQQFFFKTNNPTVKFLYEYERDIAYQAKPNLVVTEKPETLLPEEFIEDLKEGLQTIIAEEKQEGKISEIDFMLDEKLSTQEKLKKLDEYCKQFKNEKLETEFLEAELFKIIFNKKSTIEDKLINLEIYSKTKPLPSVLDFVTNLALPTDKKLTLLNEFLKTANKYKPLNDLGNLLALIKEKKGSCRHRSQVFVLLARLMGIPAHMITNEQHVLAEIPSPKGSHFQWHRYDFGGAFRFDLTPAAARTNVFKKKMEVIQRLKAITAEEKKTDQFSEEEQTIKEQYRTIFSELTRINETKSLDTFLDKTLTIPPLIMLDATQSAFAVNKKIVADLKTRGFNTDKNYCYIHSANDFDLFLQAYQLKDGQRKRIDGPLMNLLGQGGVLVVNWANFSPNEIATYKSILDSEPTLGEYKVPKNLKILGITSQLSQECSSFLSRCQPFKLSAEFFAEEKKETKETKDIKKLSVNLFNGLNWRDILFGKISIKENEMFMTEGKLLEAIRRSATEPINLIIHNPSEDSEFNLLLHRIRDEGKIFINGELISIPANLTITIDKLESVNHLSNVILDDKESKDNRLVYVGLHNIHECYEQVQSKQHKAIILDGLLKNYDSAKDIIYFTEPIPASDWQAMLHHIQENHPDKIFRYQLAPGAGIEGVHVPKPAPTLHSIPPDKLSESKAHVIVSNDADLTCDDLIKKVHKPKVFYLSPHDTFADLIGSQTVEEQKDNPQHIHFNFTEGPLLKALKAGKTVILNGDLPYPLYQQLLPLLSGEPYIQFNGERITVPGKLIAVIPAVRAVNYPLQEGIQCRYDFSHYRKAFPDEKWLEPLEQFFELARNIPHVGLGRPEEVTVSFERIKNMLAVLKSPEKTHEHNPIKGLFLYDYPKNSNDYAYLNVIGKYLFRSDDSTPLRQTKLQKIIKELNIQNDKDIKKHIWPLLNCFSGADLKKILGENLVKSIIPTGFPHLSADVFLQIANKLKPYLPTKTGLFANAEIKEIKVIKKSHVEKRMAQLKSLLKDRRTRIIMLKGPAGTGKTHTVKEELDELKKELKELGNCFEDITQCLQTPDQPGKFKVLLIDEANMFAPGTWDFLKALKEYKDKKTHLDEDEKAEEETIIYEGKEYPASNFDNLTVIATGNFESDPERFYHPIFQQRAETILFQVPEDDFLEEKALKKNINNYNEQHGKIFLSAFHLAEKLNPLYVYSIRDLENAAKRFNALVTNYPKALPHDLALKASIAEFGGTFQKPSEQTAYITELSANLHMELKEELSREPIVIKTEQQTLFLPHERSFLLQRIREDLDMREIEIEHPSGYYKQGILIEGEPGLGKSTLYEALLRERGFSDTASGYSLELMDESLPFDKWDLKKLYIGIKDEKLICYVKDDKEMKEPKEISLASLNFKTAESIKASISAHKGLDKEQTKALFDITSKAGYPPENPNKRYYKITVGNQGQADQILLKAFKEGSVVILDELNLDKRIEIMLNKMMVDGEWKGVRGQPGFMVMASQNPAYHAGRKAVSKALLNRFHVLYMDRYTPSALDEIATHAEIKFPKLFVEAYEESRKTNPSITNTRTFYYGLQQAKSMLKPSFKQV